MNTSENDTKIESDNDHQILDRLKTIRVGKTKIINLLSTLKEKENQGETIDRGLIQSLVDSYDRLKDQEEEFIVILKNISNLPEKQEPKEQASPDKISTDDTHIDNELYEAVKALRMASADSELASSIHRSLNDNIRLTQEKLDAMKLLYEKNVSDRTKISNAAMERREITQLQLREAHGELNRKQKLLDRLRKKAAAKLLSADTLSKGEDITKVTPPVVIGGDSIEERVPPVSVVDAAVEPDNTVAPVDESITDAERPDAELRANISARFAAFETRKQRMRELRAQLNRVERCKMDGAYSDAIGRLHNLTEMRKHLESLTGVNGPADDNKIRNSSIGGSPPSVTVEQTENAYASASPKSESSDRSTATDELISQVRLSFDATLQRFLNRHPRATLSEVETILADTLLTDRQIKRRKSSCDLSANTLDGSSLYVDADIGVDEEKGTEHRQTLSFSDTDRLTSICSNEHNVMPDESQYTESNNCYGAATKPFMPHCQCFARPYDVKNAPLFDSVCRLFENRLKSLENVLHTHSDQLTWIGDQTNCLVDALEQLQRQFQQQQQQVKPLQQCYNNHQRRFSNNSAITVVAGPRASVGNALSMISNAGSCSTISPVATGSQLSLLQPPSTFLQFQQKQNFQKLITPIKKCLLSADRTILSELLNAHNDAMRSTTNAYGSVEDQIDNLLHKLANGDSSPPPSATTPLMSASLFSALTSGFAPTQLAIIPPSPSESPPHCILPVVNNYEATTTPHLLENATTTIIEHGPVEFTVEVTVSSSDLLTNNAVDRITDNSVYHESIVMPDENSTSSALAFTVKKIIGSVRQWIEENGREGISAIGAEKLCELVTHKSGLGFVDLANLQHRRDEDVAVSRERFLSQLTPLVDELVEPLVVTRLTPSAIDAFICALANALRNDLAFWTLLRNADALINRRNEQ